MGAHRASWLALVTILLIGTSAAGLGRGLFGYPPCVSDEVNWAGIVQRVAAGDAWPISGVLFFQTLQALSRATGMSASSTLTLMGLVSVPIALSVIWWAYGLLRIDSRWRTLAMLAISSHFWAPLLESRPQQLGQALFLLGTALVVRAVQVAPEAATRWWFGWVFVAIGASLFHLLSFLLLLVSSACVLAWTVLSGRWNSAYGAGFALGGLTGLMVIGANSGPYASMVDDIWANHLAVVSTSSLGTAVAVLVVTISAVVWLAKSATRVDRVARESTAPFVFKSSGRLIGAIAVAAAAVVLIWQALLLPQAAWRPYGGSVLFFVVAQAGNLCLLFFIASGIGQCLPAYSVSTQRPDRDLSLALAAIAAVLCAAGLAASLVLVDRNWLLRALGYALLLLAPVAALGLPNRVPRAVAIVIGMGLAAVSFTSAVKPSALFPCG